MCLRKKTTVVSTVSSMTRRKARGYLDWGETLALGQLLKRPHEPSVMLPEFTFLKHM